jgi:hypothetical protein
MKKSAALVFSLLSLALIMAALFLMNRRKSGEEKQPGVLADRKIAEIGEIRVNNQHDAYSVYQEEGGFFIADLPMDLVNAEYLLMLLDEAARVEYIESVSGGGASQMARYGLDPPQAEAVIRYTTGESLALVFGAAERVSGGQYFMIQRPGDDGEAAVYLMDHSRVVRFLQPLKNFINFEIVPFRSFPSPLSSIKNLVLSGTAFPEPVVISGVRDDSEEDARLALSFGAVTHLIRSPRQRGIDQKEAIEVFDSLSGLLNIEALDYNCDDAALAAYGFNDPLIKAEYDFQKEAGSDPVRIVLKAARYEGGYILTRDDQRVVHRIENEAFLSTSYEKLAARWFLKPFITDIASIEIRSGQKDYRFDLSGEDNRSLAVTLNGGALDTALFRKLYVLLVSASHDGLIPENQARKNEPVLSVVFHYSDPLKSADTMSFSPGSFRRLFVTVNGVTEFTCLERYAVTLDAALSALERGEDFKNDW